MQTHFVSKEKLYPWFGYAEPANDAIFIRADLPKRVQASVIAHETYHIHDKSTNIFWREVKANAYSAWKQPIGFLYSCVLSLNMDRINANIQRFRKRK
ncbi:MAG: hypothetical protein UU10_C0041G0013 [Parcubacteria group bacterium GW2011_GWF1_40_6]|nr:MAG: hypothetical protein UU10_C0041G0013 [Parcubacteria group bacterium GW2011_GWF1_40_6]